MQNIAIVAGGYSGEYEISIKSATVVLQHLRAAGHKAYLIEITRQGWCLRDEGKQQWPVDKNDFTVKVANDEYLHFDVVFNAIHGEPGEDGKLLGYFDMIGMPYTSCGALESALSFSKFYCNQVVRQLGVQVAPSVLMYSPYDYSPQQVIEQLGFPMFVKPNNGGSSVGMSKVNAAKELPQAIEKAFAESQEVLIEAFVQGRELTMGVMEKDGKPMPLAITEIKTKNEFFDYEAKYNDKLNEEITPAPISPQWADNIKATSLHLFKALHLKGVVRFDFIYGEQGLYFLEVNTVPGLSDQSLVPQQYEYAYGSLLGLFTSMIENALQR